MNKFRVGLPRVGLYLIVLASAQGCTHRMEIKNLSQYKVTSITPLVKRISIGIVSTDSDFNVKRLIHETGTELQNYAGEVLYPYISGSQRKVDLLADIKVKPTYKGSPANFFINFPGFLIWAPAWHGYNYKVQYEIDVDLIDASKNDRVDNFSLPISLNIRHAEIDRTWTEISWFEVGVVALIGGIYCITYDPDVTPLVIENAGQVIGRHVASEIVSRVNSSGRFVYLALPRESLAFKDR